MWVCATYSIISLPSFFRGLLQLDDDLQALYSLSLLLHLQFLPPNTDSISCVRKDDYGSTKSACCLPRSISLPLHVCNFCYFDYFWWDALPSKVDLVVFSDYLLLLCCLLVVYDYGIGRPTARCWYRCRCRLRRRYSCSLSYQMMIKINKSARGPLDFYFINYLPCEPLHFQKQSTNQQQKCLLPNNYYLVAQF